MVGRKFTVAEVADGVRDGRHLLVGQARPLLARVLGADLEQEVEPKLLVNWPMTMLVLFFSVPLLVSALIVFGFERVAGGVGVERRCCRCGCSAR